MKTRKLNPAESNHVVKNETSQDHVLDLGELVQIATMFQNSKFCLERRLSGIKKEKCLFEDNLAFVKISEYLDHAKESLNTFAKTLDTTVEFFFPREICSFHGGDHVRMGIIPTIDEVIVQREVLTIDLKWQMRKLPCKKEYSEIRKEHFMVKFSYQIFFKLKWEYFHIN